MSGLITATAATELISSNIASNASRDAADKAAGKQLEGTNAGIAEQRRQFDAIQKLLAPYVQGGTKSFDAQQDIAGLNGADAQGTAIGNIENSPYFKSLYTQGENGILANASATSGLRGGNTEAALAQFRPSLLNGLVDSQFNRLGSITANGVSATGANVNSNQSFANNVSNLYGQQGAIGAGQELATGQANAAPWNTLGQLAGTFSTLKLLKAF